MSHFETPDASVTASESAGSVGIEAGVGTSEKGREHEEIVTNRLFLKGLINAALETGARFQRDGKIEEAAAWFSAPSATLDDLVPIDACLSPEYAARAAFVHAFDVPLEANVGQVAQLVLRHNPAEIVRSSGTFASERARAGSSDDSRVRRLFTSTLTARTDQGLFCAFDALVADSVEGVERHLRSRRGDRLFELTRIVEGVDFGGPHMAGLVSERMANLLEDLEVRAAWYMAEGFVFSVEQHLAS